MISNREVSVSPVTITDLIDDTDVQRLNLFVQEIDVFDDDLTTSIRLTLDGRKMKNHGVPLDYQMHVFVAVDLLETKLLVEFQ